MARFIAAFAGAMVVKSAKRHRMALLAFLMSIFTFCNPGKLAIDDYLRVVEAVMIVAHGRLDLDPAYLPPTGYAYYQNASGQLYVHWGIVSSLIYVPVEAALLAFKAVFTWFAAVEEQLGKPLILERFAISMLVMPAIMLANVVLLDSILKKYLGVQVLKNRHLLLVLAFLGTQLLRYSSGLEEGFMILLFLAAILVFEEAEGPSMKGLLIGTLAGCALNIRYMGFPAFSVFLLIQSLRREDLGRFAAFLALGLAPYVVVYLAYNYIRFDSFSPEAYFQFYVSHGFSPPNVLRSSPTDILAVFCRRAFDLLLYNPILVFAPLGCVAVLKSGNLGDARTRVLAVCSFVALYYMTIHAVLTWGTNDWSSWGLRFLTTIVPLLFLLAVPTLLDLLERRSTPARRRGGAVLVGVSFLVQGASVLGWEETEAYQGYPRHHILQRVSNLYTMTVEGNPLAPHLDHSNPLLGQSRLEEDTNAGNSMVKVEVEINDLYEGYALWPVTVGYALKWGSGTVALLILLNAALALGCGRWWWRSLDTEGSCP